MYVLSSNPSMLILQDVVFNYLTTDEIKLNLIDAEDPEVICSLFLFLLYNLQIVMPVGHITSVRMVACWLMVYKIFV